MGETHESFFLPETVKKAQRPGYMASLTGAIKKRVRVCQASPPAAI